MDHSEAKYQEVLKWFEVTEDHGGYFKAYCTGHENTDTPALSGQKHDDGVGLKCHAGCSTEEILAPLGKKPSDLFVRSAVKLIGKKGSAEKVELGCTLEQYANAKRLPADWLKQWLKLSDMPRHTKTKAPAVVIPYMSEDNQTELRIRYRTALNKPEEGEDNRFLWRYRSKADTMYGLEQLPNVRANNLPLIIVEGESDVHTLRFNGYAALGVPGASNWKAIQSANLENVSTIYLLREPDEAGHNLTEKLTELLRQEERELFIVDLPDEHDVSSLYLDNPKLFGDRFEEALEKAISCDEQERQAEREYARESWEQCKELAQRSNILSEFIDDLGRMGVVGQEKEAQIIFLAAVSRHFKTPSSIAIKGPSSGGKSYTLNKVLEFMPDHTFYKLTAMSDKALAHFDKPLKHKHLVIAEAAALDNSEMATYLIRTLLSEGFLQYIFPLATNDGIELHEVFVEGPTGLFITTTQHSLHNENETRIMSLSIDDTRAQTRAVIQSIANKTKVEIDMTRWHALQEWLALDETTEVVIPYAPWLSIIIPDEAMHVRLRRDFTQVINLIESHALLHRNNRERNDEGEIIATCEDYTVVRDLLYDVIAEGLEASVPVTVRETVEALEEIYKKLENKSDGVTVHVLKNKLELERSVVQRRMQDALRRGFVKNLEEKRGRAGRYIPADPLPDDVIVLPEVEKLVASGMCSCARCVAVLGGSTGDDAPQSTNNTPETDGSTHHTHPTQPTQPTHPHTIEDTSNGLAKPKKKRRNVEFLG